MIDLAKTLRRIARGDGVVLEHFGKIGDALKVASLGDYRASLTAGQVKLLSDLADEASLGVLLGQGREKGEDQRSRDGYGVEDWDKT